MTHNNKKPCRIVPHPMIPADPYTCPVCGKDYPNTHRSYAAVKKTEDGKYEYLFDEEEHKCEIIPICSHKCFYAKYPKGEESQ